MLIVASAPVVPPVDPAGWGDLVTNSPAAAAVIIVVWLFMRFLRDQRVDWNASQERRETARMEHEKRLAEQYAAIAKSQEACIRENTAAFIEYAKERA